MQEYQLYIDGAFRDAAGGKTADSINPAPEEPWARIARASRTDTQRAIAAARRAFDEGPWPRMSPADRKKILNQIADGLEARSQEIAAVETQDSGGTIRKTSGDMMLGAAQLRYFAEMAEKVRSEEHTSELQSRVDLVCRLLLEKKKKKKNRRSNKP